MNENDVEAQVRAMIGRTSTGIRTQYAEGRALLGIDAPLAILVELRDGAYTVACGERAAVLHVITVQFPNDAERLRNAFAAMDATQVPIVGLWLRDGLAHCGILSLPRSTLDQLHCERAPRVLCTTLPVRANVCAPGVRRRSGLGGMLN
jgi:hypothetical protein